jgi:hypothetical protein
MPSVLLLVLLVTFLSAHAPLLQSEAVDVRGRLLKSKTFLSPPIPLRPGEVSNKFYHDVDFPRGHVALKSLEAEVVDAGGAPVPLHEACLHPWIVEPYHVAVGVEPPKRVVAARNSGVCGGALLGQYYGLGSETRRTATWVPDPYGVHAIDTRGPPARVHRVPVRPVRRHRRRARPRPCAELHRRAVLLLRRDPVQGGGRRVRWW